MRARIVARFVGALLILIIGLGAAPRGGHASGAPVNVFYAGSLVNLNENLVGPAFTSATGYAYQGKSAGSVAIATQITSRLANPDVIELADPSVNQLLMGKANGSYVSWYFTYAHSELVIGFDPRSRYAREFRLVQKRKLAFYKALQQRGLRIGRTDPQLDPKGYRAIWMANLTGKVYHLRNFERRLFGAAENSSQVFPEETLVARLLTGQLDAGVFYLSEVKDLGIPYIALPAKVNLGSDTYKKLYARQRFKTSAGKVITGAPIQYTITIPSTVKNQSGAEAFVRFVLGKRVRTVAAAHGLLQYHIKVGGARGAVPKPLIRFIGT